MRKDKSSTAIGCWESLNHLSQIIIGDKAIFQLNGNVSNHNVIRYAPRGDPPKDFVYDKPSSGEKLVLYGSG